MPRARADSAMDPTQHTAEPISKARGALCKRTSRRAENTREQEREEGTPMSEKGRMRYSVVLEQETFAAACGGPFAGVEGCFLKEQQSVESPCWSRGKG